MEICRKDRNAEKLYAFLRERGVQFSAYSVKLDIVTIKESDWNADWNKEGILQFDSADSERREKEIIEWFGKLGAILGKEYRKIMEGK